MLFCCRMACRQIPCHHRKPSHWMGGSGGPARRMRGVAKGQSCVKGRNVGWGPESTKPAESGLGDRERGGAARQAAHAISAGQGMRSLRAASGAGPACLGRITGVRERACGRVRRQARRTKKWWCSCDGLLVCITTRGEMAALTRSCKKMRCHWGCSSYLYKNTVHRAH